MDVLVVVVILGFIALVWVFKSEMKKLCGEVTKTGQSIDSLHLDNAKLNLALAFVSEMKKLGGHIAKAESIDSLRGPDHSANSTRQIAKIATTLEELQDWLCGSNELRSRTLEAFHARKLDEGENIYLTPILPQIVTCLDDIRRAVENAPGFSQSPLEVATQEQLQQAADAAILAVGSSTVSHLSLLTRAARNKLRGKLFDDIDLSTVVLAQMGRSKGAAPTKA